MTKLLIRLRKQTNAWQFAVRGWWLLTLGSKSYAYT